MTLRSTLLFIVSCLTLSQASAFAQAYSDEQLYQAWEQLPEAEQSEIAEWFRYESQALNNLQSRLIRSVGESVETDRGFWPLEGPKPFFSPGGKRKRIEIDSEQARALRNELGIESSKELWSYDFGSRRLIRHGELRDADRVFSAALEGRLPDFDFTIREVCRLLDDGSLLDAQAALSHAYSNSDGAVFPSITLYDFLAAGKQRMLCEEDALGVLRYVEDSSDPESEQEQSSSLAELNQRVRAVFEEARAGREMVETLAQVFLDANPKLPEQFKDIRELHGLWISSDEDPKVLQEALPKASQVASYMKAWKETFRLKRLRTKATYRQRDLAFSERDVRALLERIMEQSDAFAPRPEVEVIEVVEESSAPETPAPSVAAIEFSPEAQAALFERIDKAKRRDRLALIENCLQAAYQSGAPQVELVKYWASQSTVARKDLPEKTVLGSHDPKLFGGGPKRKTIGPGKKRWDRLAAQVELEADPEFDLGVDYEPATKKVVSLHRRREDWFEIELLLGGKLPDQDLARAELLASLAPHGRLQREIEFFAHDYTDRDGKAYGGISLGEVWSSSVALEVPDVDALAYIRTVWEDTSVKYPLTDLDHSEWYPRISNSLKRVRHRNQVSLALAAVWFDGRPKMSNGYDASIDILQALIAKNEESAKRILEALDRDGMLFVQRGLKSIIKLGDAAWNKGNRRRDKLTEGRIQIRQAVLKTLKAGGWLDD